MHSSTNDAEIRLTIARTVDMLQNTALLAQWGLSRDFLDDTLHAM
jgi:hypothetical protein